MSIDHLKVQKMFKRGLSYGTIGKLFGVSRQRIYQIIRGLPETNLQNLKLQVFTRDVFQCQWGDKCSPTTEKTKLVMHHIDLKPSNNKMNNLITVCESCHKKFHRIVRQENPKRIKRDKAILTMYKTGGYSMRELAKHFKCGLQTILNAIHSVDKRT